MSTKHSSEAFMTELPKISHADIDRIVSDAERMRAEHLAGLLRSVGRGIARLAHAALAALRMQRPGERSS